MKDFHDILAALAWSLWTELGVAGLDRFHKDCLIPLEELVLFTALVSSHDPRLRDEALDWLSHYHEYISISRLRTFIKLLDPTQERTWNQFAATLNSLTGAKWPVPENTAPLKVTLKGKSILASLQSPSLLLLRLRSLFGPGVKADVLTTLLTTPYPRLSASDLSLLGYSKRSILTALDHFATAGILAVSQNSNKNIYELKTAKQWQTLIGKLPKIAPPWSFILQAILILDSSMAELPQSSSTTKGILLYNVLKKIEPLLPQFIPSILSEELHFEKNYSSLLQLFKAFQHGNFYMHFQVSDPFETIIIQILCGISQVLDCIDGIDMILDKAQQEPNLHEKVYKESAQLYVNFFSDLLKNFEEFLKLPFHMTHDEELSDLSYQFIQHHLPELARKITKIKEIPIREFHSAERATLIYRKHLQPLEQMRQFIQTFQNRLQELYFIRTQIHLFTDPASLHKRHLVLDLYAR